MAESRAQGPSAAAIEELSEAECHEVLAAQRLGVVAMSDDNEPYAIPMFYGYDPERGELFVGISEGRKTRILDGNPRVSITVSELGSGGAWSSVIVAGRAEWIGEGADRQRAIRVLMDHNRKFQPASPAASAPPPPRPEGEVKMSQRNHSGGRMMRVADAKITGRAKR